MCDNKTSVFDLEDFLKNNNGELSPEERKAKSINECGWPIFRSQPDGSIKRGLKLCGFFRECPNCRRIRFLEFKTRLERISEQADDIVSIVCDDKTANSLLRKRKIKSESYFRSPASDGVIITISQSLLEEVKFDDYIKKLELKDKNGEIDELIINSYTDTPERKRTSGKLGYVPEIDKKEPDYTPVDEDDTVEIELPKYVIDPNSASVDHTKLFVDAIMETSSSRHRKAIFAVVMNERCHVYESLLRKNNVEFSVLNREVVKVSRKWLKENFVFIEKCETVKIKSSISLQHHRKHWSKEFTGIISDLFNKNHLISFAT